MKCLAPLSHGGPLKSCFHDYVKVISLQVSVIMLFWVLRAESIFVTEIDWTKAELWPLVLTYC